MANPYNTFIEWERQRQGWSQLEAADRYANRYGNVLRLRRIGERTSLLNQAEQGQLSRSIAVDIETPTGSDTVLFERGASSGIQISLQSAKAKAIGLGVGGAIGAGVGAYVLNKGLTLPGHEYVGPGNPIDEKVDKSVDEDDSIAREHDLAYNKAKTEDDIRKADDIAIHKFETSYKSKGNIHAKVASIGLQAKQFLEYLHGKILYPQGLNSGNFFLDMAKPKPPLGNKARRMRNTQAYNASLQEPDAEKAYKQFVVSQSHINNWGQFDLNYRNWIVKRQENNLSVNFPDPRSISRADSPLSGSVVDDYVSEEWSTVDDDKLKRLTDIVNKFNDSLDQGPPKKKQKITGEVNEGASTSTATEMAPPPKGSSELSNTSNPTQASGSGTSGAGGQPMELDTDAARQDKGAGKSSAPGTQIYHIGRPLMPDNTYTRYFRKQHKFFTFGLAWVPLSKTIAASAGNHPAYTQYIMTSSLAEIPAHKLPLYLNFGEYDSLPNGSYVDKVKITVFQRNPIMQFETGGTTTKLATLNQNKNCIWAKGLNLTGYGMNCCYTGFDATETMIPTAYGYPAYSSTDGYLADYEGLAFDLYGYTNTTITGTNNFTNNTPKHCFGQCTTLKNYWSTMTYSLEPTNGGWPELQHYINEWDGSDALGMPVAEYEYEPLIAPIKGPLRNICLRPISGKAMQVNAGTGYDGGDQISITQSTDGTAVTLPTDHTHAELNRFQRDQFGNFNYETTPIEKSSYIQYGFRHAQNVRTQPSLHVGVMPSPSLSTPSLIKTNSTFTDTRAYFDVTCEMWVKWRIHNELVHDDAPRIPPSEGLYRYDPNVNQGNYDNSTTYAGLIVKENILMG